MIHALILPVRANKSSAVSPQKFGITRSQREEIFSGECEVLNPTTFAPEALPDRKPLNESSKTTQSPASTFIHRIALR